MQLGRRYIKIFLAIVLAITVLLAGGYLYTKNQKDNIENALQQMISQLTNKDVPIPAASIKNGMQNKDIVFFAENFYDNERAVNFDNKAFNVVWLGSRSHLNLASPLFNADLILTSSPLLTDVLRQNGKNAFLFPLFTDDNLPKMQPADKRYYAIVGNPPYIEEILMSQKIFYRKYDLNDTKKIYRDMPYFKALFAENADYTDNSLDINPLLLQAAALEIPIASYWVWPDEDRFNLFNDKVNFYADRNFALRLVDDINNNAPSLLRRVKSAKNLVLKEFSLKSAKQRLKYLLSQISHGTNVADIVMPQTAIEPHSLNYDLPVAIGDTTSGDYWIVSDVDSVLQNYNLYITFYNSYYKYKTDFNIILRGVLYIADNDLAGKSNIFWLLYPQFGASDQKENVPDENTYIDELVELSHKVNVMLLSSSLLARRLQEKGIKAHYVPQFTNTDRFYPDYHEELKSEVFFVGANTFYRKAAYILLNNNLPITIYGPGWPAGVTKGQYIDNRQLRKYYSSAKIVLNDTRDGMKEFGVISNRIYDATACGTLIISDYMPEIEEIYGDTVPMWKTEEELVALVQYYLDPAHEQERLEKANRAREITLKNFTHKQVAEKINTVLQELAKETK